MKILLVAILGIFLANTTFAQSESSDNNEHAENVPADELQADQNDSENEGPQDHDVAEHEE